MKDTIIIDDQTTADKGEGEPLKEIIDFKASLAPYSQSDRARIISALYWAKDLHKEQKRASGQPYIIHPIAVGKLLVHIGVDAVTVIAGLLHDVLEDTDKVYADVEERFGKDVAFLVESVTNPVLERSTHSYFERKAENIRKILMATVEDIRTILIKLADKTHNMTTLQYKTPQSQKLTARECLDIYAPLAGKFGINVIQSQLEDLAFKVLFPGMYDHIKIHVAEGVEKRQAYLKEVETSILQLAEEANIQVDIKTRAKHFYSIYKKMKLKQKDISEIYDFLGVRILCETEGDCYVLLGLVHSLWQPLDGRFKDYISAPKDNGYRSLHTTVLCADGRSLEVQIRTEKMQEVAEYGVASHYYYREKKKASIVKGDDIAVIRNLRKLREGDYDTTQFLSFLKDDILKDVIVLYTPDGDPVILPRESTAIDFAYRIHSDIGDHCVGAMADGSIVRLNAPLKNTQTIEIKTSPLAKPHLNWLRTVRTSRARVKIKTWFNQNDNNVTIDKDLIVVNRKKRSLSGAPVSRNSIKPLDNTGKKSGIGIRVNQYNDILVQYAGCCKPSVGDPIIGYVSRGRGIIVHKEGCPNLKGMSEFDERRVDEIYWDFSSHKNIESFEIYARKSEDLFSKIEWSIRKYKGRLVAGGINETERNDYYGNFTIETEKAIDGGRIRKSILAIPAVKTVKRSEISSFDSQDNDGDVLL